MISELLSYTWKGVTGYSYGYILVSNISRIDDIKKDKRTKVLWGGVNLISLQQNVY